VWAYLLAVLATGAFADRYTLPAVGGMGILLALAVRRAAEGRTWPGVALAALTLVGAGEAQLWQEREDVERFIPPAQMIRPLVEDAPEPIPIVVCNPDHYLQLMYYAPRAVTDRLLYLEGGQNTAELVLKRLRRYAPLRVESVTRFSLLHAAGTRFYLYGRSDDWLATYLVVRGADMRVVYLDVRRMLAVVDLPPLDANLIELYRQAR
jgi:hypothetical protein